MSYRAKLKTPPTKAAVPLRDMKNFMRVDDDDENALIKSLAMAATDYAERYLRRSLVTQTWVYYLDSFPHCDHIDLPHGPIQSITSISYTDNADATQVVSSSTYALDQGNEVDQRVFLKDGETWPQDEAIERDTVAIEYVAGYGDEESVPDDVKTAIMLIANHWYENREAVVVGTGATEVPMSAKSILDKRRVLTVV